MLKKLKLLSLTIASLTLFAAPLATPSTASAASANIQSGVCQGADQLQVTTTPNESCSSLSTNGEGKVNTLITEIVNIISVIVGIIAVIMIIVGGFKYVTSGGKQESVTEAKNTILYAIIGLVIVALAQIIVRFVLNKATGT